MLTGLSRPKQMLYFFEQNQEEIYSTNYISQYICNNFDLSKKKIPKSGISMMQQINNEVSSNFTKLMKPNNNRPVNFEQHHYDWLDLNSKNFDLYARRFWIVEN